MYLEEPWAHHLDLGGARNPFWKWRFKVSDMEPELHPFGSLIHQNISQVLASGFWTQYQFTSPDDGRFGSIRNGYKDEEMLEKVEVGKDAKECFT